jgi:hypothetical protein
MIISSQIVGYEYLTQYMWDAFWFSMKLNPIDTNL